MGFRQTVTSFLKRPEPVILMYHRVASLQFDPWGLSVSPLNFESQLARLSRRRDIFPLREFVACHLAGKLPPKAVAITFDDGYLDNLTAAAPILRTFGAPATLFLASGPMKVNGRYWWDELARIVFSPGALNGCVTIGAQPMLIVLPRMQAGEVPGRNWRAWHEPATERQALHYKLWQDMRVLPSHEIDLVLAELRLLCGEVAGENGPHAMSRVQARTLASETNFTLEGHTIDHPDLPSWPDEEIVAQVRGGMVEIEALAGKAAAGFAYPYGRSDARVRTLVRAAGVQWACTTQCGPVRPGCDHFALPRLTAADTPGIDWAGVG